MKLKLLATLALLTGASAADAALITRSYTTEKTFSSGPISNLVQSYTLTYDPNVEGVYAVSNYYTSSDNQAFRSPVLGYLNFGTAIGVAYKALTFSRPGATFGVQAGTNDFADSFNVDSSGNYTNRIGNLSSPGSEIFTVSGNNSVYQSTSFTFRDGFEGPTGVVPEPATWAMMLIGFGMAGAVMRRRRRQAVAFA